ncbi:hypothetical protein SAMN05216276_10422 [Streptosporangium subroseum]|uniref:Uncharacterized protein n=1 Tax=Streptosporangium subroseum TaxID=106412 RepID=A0A239MIR5_9ACTN|nr:hypothetical protein SAMN05216276_10422 [Streptosporangium subroseum]
MPAGPWASLPERLVTDRLAELMNANADLNVCQSRFSADISKPTTHP